MLILLFFTCSRWGGDES